MENKCNMSQEGILNNLRKGLNSEKRALDLCAQLLELVDNKEDKEDIEKIMKDEANHIKITNELIETISNNYINNK